MKKKRMRDSYAMKAVFFVAFAFVLLWAEKRTGLNLDDVLHNHFKPLSDEYSVLFPLEGTVVVVKVFLVSFICATAGVWFFKVVLSSTMSMVVFAIAFIILDQQFAGLLIGGGAIATLFVMWVRGDLSVSSAKAPIDPSVILQKEGGKFDDEDLFSAFEINPLNGFPMAGGVDIMGTHEGML